MSESKTVKETVQPSTIVYVVAVAGPLTGVPQVIAVWTVSATVGGLSLASWILFLISSCIWLWYGVIRKDVPLILSNSLWVVVEALIVLGIFFCRNG